MKVPGYEELIAFELFHFDNHERDLLNAEAAKLGRAGRVSMDDSTLTAADYHLDGVMTRAWHSACPCGWISGPVFNQEQAVQVVDDHQRTDCPGRTITGETML